VADVVGLAREAIRTESKKKQDDMGKGRVRRRNLTWGKCSDKDEKITWQILSYRKDRGSHQHWG